MTKLLLILVSVFVWWNQVFADTHACNGTASSCQSAINAASDGDIVSIPAGNFTWTSGVTINSKNITLQGEGIGVTNLTAGTTGCLISVVPSTKPFRISGFTISTTVDSDGFIRIRNGCNQSTACEPPDIVGTWRIDHIRFNINSGGRMYPCIQVTQDDPGLVDNCYFYNGGTYLIGLRHLAANGSYDATHRTQQWGEKARTRATGMGTADAVFMEDNTVERGSSGGYTTICDAEGSSRLVIRYNTFIGRNIGVQSHSTGNLGRGQVFMELYNNTWTTDNTGTNIGIIRSGTGVIYNNSFVGTPNFLVDNERSCSSPPAGANNIPGARCYGSGTWDGNLTGEQGWPCLDQIGMGSSTSPGAYGNYNIHEPMYVWNNGGLIFETGSLCALSDTHVRSRVHSNGQVDYVVGSAKPGYAPYIYPHPSRTGNDSPATPQNLRVVQ